MIERDINCALINLNRIQIMIMQRGGQHAAPGSRPKSSNVNITKPLATNSEDQDVCSKSIEAKKPKEEHQQAQAIEQANKNNPTHVGLSHISSAKQGSLTKHLLNTSGNESDRSFNSSIVSLSLKPHPFKINIGSTSTIRSYLGAQIGEAKQVNSKPKNVPSLPIAQQADQVPTTTLQVLHQDLRSRGNKEVGSHIRGRKIDSPRLVVVKELKDQEDDDGKLDSKIRNHGQRSYSRENNQNKSVDKTKDIKRQARSQENRRKRSKERPPQFAFNIKPPAVPTTKLENKKQKPNQTFIQNKAPQKVISQLGRKQRSQSKGTKSSRDIKTSIGFSDLLNNLDKEINQQQSNFSRDVLDFKNRTTHGVIGTQGPFQNTGPKPDEVQEKSRSRERTEKVLSQAQRQNIIQSLQAVLPKSLITATLSNMNKEKKRKPSNNLTDVTPEKTKQSFIQGSEHGRCVTSQALHQSSSCTYNPKLTIESQNLSSQYSVAGGPHRQNLLNDSHHNNKVMKDQSSPDHSQTTNTIDHLIKQNLKKQKQRQEENKLKRQASEEKLKRKKEIIDQNNNLVRLINKEKTYKKIVLAKNQALGNQQSQEFVQGIQTHQKLEQSLNDVLPPKVIKVSGKLGSKIKNLQKLSQSQKVNIPLEARKMAHRKSYGLEFIEIKKEIQEELKTIEQHHNYVIQQQVNNDFDIFANPQVKHAVALGRKQAEEPVSMLEMKSNDSQHASRNGIDEDPSFRLMAMNHSQRADEEGGSKLVVVKKSKIKKFMKMKKKEKQKEIMLTHNSEILRTIKMQENISKLNEFCKKNLQRNISKKRNATIQHQNTSIRNINQKTTDASTLVVNQPSGRRQTGKKEALTLDINNDDSSRLSTEFYEEYYRLLNSLKKGESRAKASSPKGDTEISATQGASPKASRDNKRKQAVTLLTKLVKKRTKSARKHLKAPRTKHEAINQTLIDDSRVERFNKASKNKERSESAPLEKRRAPKKDKGKLEMTETELQLLSIFLNQQATVIQKAYRRHLARQGFYGAENSIKAPLKVLDMGISGQSSQNSLQQPEQMEVPTVRREENGEENGIVSMQEEDVYGDEYDDECPSQQDIIIINEQVDDDKKVVYLSNINSCSLPQTPKPDEQQSQDSSVPKALKKPIQYVPKAELILEQVNQEGVSGFKELLSQETTFRKEEDLFSSQSLRLDQLEVPATMRKEDETQRQTAYQMRLFTGSESLLRELKMSTPKEKKNSAIKMIDVQSSGHGSKRVLTSQNSQKSFAEYAHQSQHSMYTAQQEDTAQRNAQTSQSQSSHSLFDRNSFQKFTADKLKNIVKDNEFMHLIQMREKALDYRQDKEKRYIKKLLKQRQLSPRTYTQRKDQLEKWVRLEQDEINKSKRQFQEEWDKTVQMIEDTQKNVEIMREQIKPRHLQHASGYSSQQNDLQSSRNSNGSYVTTSHKLERKSLLSQEELQPLSHRSNRLSLIQEFKQPEIVEQKNEDENLLEFLEDSWKKTQLQQPPAVKPQAGILIEDQNDIKRVQEEEPARPSCENSDLKPEEDLGPLPEEETPAVVEEERQLTHSRSEQDLTDLLKKTRQQIVFENEEGQDSFRVESERYDFKQKAGDIRIQENLFDDSSQRQLSNHDFYPQSGYDNELASHDSLLNEQELNSHFKDRFSIEDFKNLDKKTLLEEPEPIILFQNTKPGENIKIADILRKSQQAEEDFKFSLQEVRAPNKFQLASQIADELFAMLIKQEVELPLQQQTAEPVFVAVYNEKEQRKELIEFRQRMLIEQDLQRIETYINEVITMLQHHELNYLEGLAEGYRINEEPNYHRQFLSVLTIPIKRGQLDLLNQLQTSEIGSYEHFETALDISLHPILPVDLYLDIERQREEDNIRNIHLENSVVQESVHIHNKAVFDALNESLMKFRPYGIQGEPMPWSNKVRRLQTKVDTNQVDTERLFFMVKQDVMRWAQNCIGCLPSSIFVVRRQPEGQPALDQFDEEIFQETRERRLAGMLAGEVAEQEHQWLNYEFEESQVKIDLSDMILEHLVEELVVFLNGR